MNRRRHLAFVVLGMGTLLLVLGCASAEEERKKARAADFDRWLGQNKQNTVRVLGPPDRCSKLQSGPGEVCEWPAGGNPLRYHYDANGIARQWTYTDRQSGLIEQSQDQTKSQSTRGGFWEAVTDTFGNMQIGPGGGH